MRINTANTQEVQDALATAQKRVRERRLTPDHIQALATTTEARLDALGCPKVHRKGSQASIHIPVSTKSYGPYYVSTKATIERGADSWFLVDIRRPKISPGTSTGVTVRLTSAARESLADQFHKRITNILSKEVTADVLEIPG